MPTIKYRNKAGDPVPGVTTVIGHNLGWNCGALMYWANQMGLKGLNHREEAAKAADAGTLCHLFIDADIKGYVPDISKFNEQDRELANQGFKNYQKWKRLFNVVPLETEVNLVSEALQVGGTPDLIGMVDGELYIIDWKTSNGVYADHVIQLAAYKAIWDENRPDTPITGGFHLLRIGKESASFHHHHWGELPDCLEAFKLARQLHDMEKRIKKLL